MPNTPLTINLNQDWSLYAMTTFQLPGVKSSGDAPKGIMLPATTIEQDVVAEQLNTADKKQQLHESIKTDNPQPHFLGMLQYTNDIEAVVQQIAITAIEKEAEWDTEEHITLTLKDGQATTLEEIRLNLAIFDDASEDAPLAEAGIERLDAQLIFLDESGKQLHQQVLAMDAGRNSENRAVYDLGKVVRSANEGALKSGGKLKEMLPNVKKIIVVIKRIWKKIKQAIAQLKQASTSEIIKRIRFIKNQIMTNIVVFSDNICYVLIPFTTHAPPKKHSPPPNIPH